MLMFLAIIVAVLVPTNLTIFMATILSGGLMMCMVILILKDEEATSGDYPVE